MTPPAQPVGGDCDTSPMNATPPDDDLLQRIRALLSQAESTTFPEEAEAFTAKATELMTRYAIDAALLWDVDQRDEEPQQMIIELRRPFVPQKAVLVHQVARSFGCSAIRLGRHSGSGVEPVAIVGYRSDLAMVELLLTSLLVQLTTAMTSRVAEGPSRTAAQVASYRRSFIMGFTGAVSTRLHAQTSTARRQRDDDQRTAGSPGSSSSTAVVLADRAASVDQAFRRHFPMVRTSSISVGSSAAGRAAGSEAGRRADLGRDRLSNRAELGRAG